MEIEEHVKGTNNQIVTRLKNCRIYISSVRHLGNVDELTQRRPLEYVFQMRLHRFNALILEYRIKLTWSPEFDGRDLVIGIYNIDAHTRLWLDNFY